MANGYYQDERLFSDKDLEEEFVTWTHIFNYDAGALQNLGVPSIDNEGYTLINQLTAGNSLSIDRYGNVTVNVGQLMTPQWDMPKSHTNKYFFEYLALAPINTIGIFRHGILIWTRLITLDNPAIRFILNADMSPNGRFLAVLCDEPITFEDRHLVVYEGS
ncbi:MAG: hypothetical protein HWN68_12830 [Desulfobacterales bacterium]|nr:hypothetical protein [Desulfobacterales bacterium]